LGLEPDVLALMLRQGRLVRVSAEFVYLPEQLDEVRTLIRGLEPEFTVADFRDAAGLTRKYAVPILEWADKDGLTVRRGDVRRLR
jgi:selenocysteine-specific elongation factor